MRVVKRDRRALSDLVDGVYVFPRSPGVDALAVERQIRVKVDCAVNSGVLESTVLPQRYDLTRNVAHQLRKESTLCHATLQTMYVDQAIQETSMVANHQQPRAQWCIKNAFTNNDI